MRVKCLRWPSCGSAGAFSGPLRWEPLLSPFQLSESSGMIVPESGGRRHERALQGPVHKAPQHLKPLKLLFEEAEAADPEEISVCERRGWGHLCLESTSKGIRAAAGCGLSNWGCFGPGGPGGP